MTRLWLGLFLLLSSCATVAPLTYRDLELPAKINTDPNLLLTKKAIEQDKAQLIYALNSAYSGKKNLPAREFDRLITEVTAISGPLTAKDFCLKIAQAFDRVSDNHLSTDFDGKHCSEQPARIPQVGKNYFQSDKLFWDVRNQQIKGIPVTLISILSFPDHSDPRWVGFIGKVKASLPKSQMVVLDMRANGGGDDTKGNELARLLAGATLKSPYLPQWTNNSPEAMQMFVNTFSLWKRDFDERHEPVPHHIAMLIGKFVELREKAIQGTLSNRPFADDTSEPEEDFDLNKSVKRPIYILLDAKCVSSCESTTDAFEYNKLVKRVGERTGGYIHFGNNGNLVLTRSGVFAHISISYNSYKDGRFLEKKGIAPDLLVPAGQDALDYAIDDYKKTKSTH